MAKKEEKLKTASVLAFERKLDPSDALFSTGKWEDRTNGAEWNTIPVRVKSVRGTISNRLGAKGQDPAKLDAEIQKPNLQTVDVAALSNDNDTLRLRFTLRVLGSVDKPSTCNNPDYRKKLQETTRGYIEQVGFSELARRYAHNLANARFLWRNRLGSEKVEVTVSRLEDGKATKKWQFDALDLPMRSFDVSGKQEQPLKELASLVEDGLKSEGCLLLEVVAYARIGDGQEIYPSQELILDKGNDKGRKSKTLYTVGDVAAMHSQKIGNAIRTIDTWYDDEDGLGPIPVEPYGSVTSEGKAYRQPKDKSDFYNLLDGWVLKDEAPDEGNQHFVIANLVRGGVFGGKE